MSNNSSLWDRHFALTTNCPLFDRPRSNSTSSITSAPTWFTEYIDYDRAITPNPSRTEKPHASTRSSSSNSATSLPTQFPKYPTYVRPIPPTTSHADTCSNSSSISSMRSTCTICHITYQFPELLELDCDEDYIIRTDTRCVMDKG